MGARLRFWWQNRKSSSLIATGIFIVLIALITKANLSGANLSGADLSSASLTEANLTKTILSDADLSGADLSGATGTTPEQLKKARSLKDAIMPDGSKHP